MIPPHELKNREFTKVLRGYSAVEVDEHIDFIIEKYTEIYRENDELERKLKTALAEVEELKTDEESIRSALVNAQRASANIISEANERADLILRSAKNNCDKIIVDFRNKIKKERDTLYELRKTVEKFKTDIFSQYQQHILYLEQIAPDKDDSAEWAVTDDEYVKDAVRKVKTDVAAGAEKITRRIYQEQPVPPSQTEPSAKDKTAELAADKLAVPDDSDMKIIPDEPEKPAADNSPEQVKAPEFTSVPVFEEQEHKPASVKDTIMELNKKFSINSGDEESDDGDDDDELLDFVEDDDSAVAKEIDVPKK